MAAHMQRYLQRPQVLLQTPAMLHSVYNCCMSSTADEMSTIAPGQRGMSNSSSSASPPIQQKQPQASLKRYHDIMLHLIDKKRPELLRDVVEEMQLFGIAPKRQTYLLVASYSLQARRLNDALWAFQELQRHGMPLHVRDYAALIDGTGFAKQPDLFHRFTKLFEQAKLTPDASYYRACLRASGALGEYVRAQQLVLDMVQAGITPAAEDFASLIASYGNAAQPPADFVTTILDLVERSKLVTAGSTEGQSEQELAPAVVNAAIRALGTKQYPQLALALYNRADAEVSANLTLLPATALLHSLAIDAAGLARRDVPPAVLQAALLGGTVAQHEAAAQQGDDATVVDVVPTTDVSCVGSMLGDAHHLYAAVNPSGAFAGPLAHVQAYKDALLARASPAQLGTLNNVSRRVRTGQIALNRYDVIRDGLLASLVCMAAAGRMEKDHAKMALNDAQRVFAMLTHVVEEEGLVMAQQDMQLLLWHACWAEVPTSAPAVRLLKIHLALSKAVEPLSAMSLTLVYAAMQQKEQAGNSKLLERVHALITEHSGYSLLSPAIRATLASAAPSEETQTK